MTDYDDAVFNGITSTERYFHEHPHHPMTERLIKFLENHDFYDYDDYFEWNFGGEGDNGEVLAYQLDAFFETLDLK